MRKVIFANSKFILLGGFGAIKKRATLQLFAKVNYIQTNSLVLLHRVWISLECILAEQVTVERICFYCYSVFERQEKVAALKPSTERSVCVIDSSLYSILLHFEIKALWQWLQK